MRLTRMLQVVATEMRAVAHSLARRGLRRARLAPATADVYRAHVAVWSTLVRRGTVLGARRGDVFLAEIRYRSRSWAAGRELRRAEERAAAVVAETETQMRAHMEPQQLARYGPFELYDDSLRGPDWEVSLQSVRAHMVEPGAVVLRGGGPELATLPPTLDHPEREHLVVSGRRGVSAVECPAGDDRAGSFANFVNVASLNSSRFDRRRRAAAALSAEQLEQTRAWALHQIVEARAGHERTVGDRRRIDEARRALVRVQIDMAPLDRRRQLLSSTRLERAETRAALGLSAAARGRFRQAATSSAGRLAAYVRGRAAG